MQQWEYERIKKNKTICQCNNCSNIFEFKDKTKILTRNIFMSGAIISDAGCSCDKCKSANIRFINLPWRHFEQ